MNDTLDVILVNRCDQSDKFQTVLPAKMCVRVLMFLMLAAAAVLVVGAASAATGCAEEGESIRAIRWDAVAPLYDENIMFPHLTIPSAHPPGYGLLEAEEGEIIFIGNAIEYHEASMPGAPWGWTVDVGTIFSGPQPCSDYLNVTTAAVAPPCGNMDLDIVEGMEIEVYGYYSEDQNGCGVSLIGSESYYLKENNWGAFWVEFKGNATTDEDYTDFMCSGSYYCTVQIEEILHDPYNTLEVGNEYTVCYGSTQKNIKAGDKLEVSGDYYPTWGSLQCAGKVLADYIEQSDFFIRPACQDKDGTALDNVSYEFIGHTGFSGTVDYNTYIDAPGQGSFQVGFWKDDLQATATLESHSQPFAGTVVTLRSGGVHNIDTGEGFETIQAAINDPDTKDGHTITVDCDNYYENVYLNKSLALIGRASLFGLIPMIDAQGGYHAIQIIADNCEVRGFRCVNATAAQSIPYASGIGVSSDMNTIEDNICEDNLCGISLSWCSYNSISNNIIAQNEKRGGMHLFVSSDNTISNNAIYGHGYSYTAINLYSSPQNYIFLNDLVNSEGIISISSHESDCIWNTPSMVTYTYHGNTYINHLGNYWSDYTGEDADGDGVGDDICKDIDNYSLKESSSNYRIEKADAKFRGKVINILHPEFLPPIYEVEIEDVIDAPLGELYVGDDTEVSYPQDTSAEVDSGIEEGKFVEVCGEYHGNSYDISLAQPEHYLKIMLTAPPVHNLDTGEDFLTIQAAINDPETSALHTITVDPGVYSENVKITMPLTIKSTSGSPGDTIVQAKNSDDHVFTYTACWVGFGCNISDFTIKGGVNGVYLGKYTNNCEIYNNKIFNNTCGISLDSSSNNTLESNNVSNNDENIHLKNSPNNKINGNNASFSKWDIGICLSNSNYNEITNNTVDSNGWMGISLASSSYNKLVKNRISNNRESGIDLAQQGGGSNNNTITENNITANGWGGPMGGINVWESNNNKIYLNNFINNTINVQSYESTNIWNSTEELTYIYDGSIFASYLGNYWDDYTEKYPSASEIGSTGIWDTPYGYGMDGDEDDHPLADHFEKYIPTDTEIGTLVVNVYNVNGDPAAEVDGTTSVELIRSGETSPIAEQTIDAESEATFSNVPAGEYYINVRHDPPMEQGDEEFWGQWEDISITTGTTTTIDFYRHTPYVEEFYAEKSPVAIDTPAKINVTIKVPSNYTGTEAYVKTSVIIRDEDGHEVYQDMSSSRIVQRGDNTAFSFSYTPTEAGKYYGLAKAYVVGGGELCTDNCGWVEMFEVEYPPTQIKLNATGGEPAVFVDVTILDDGAKIAEGITDLNGTVKFNLPPGGYNVTFIEDGKNIQISSTEEFEWYVSGESMEKIRRVDFTIVEWMGEVVKGAELGLSHGEDEISGILESYQYTCYIPNGTTFKAKISKDSYITVEFKFNTSSRVQIKKSNNELSYVNFGIYLVSSPYKELKHSGFEPFLDGYSFYNFGTEVGLNGTCAGMVSTAELYYGYRTGNYEYYNSENYSLPLPVNDHLFFYTPEYYIDYNKTTKKSGYYDDSGNLSKKDFNGLEITPVDDVQLAMLFHQGYQKLLKTDYSTDQIDEILNRLDGGHPVYITIVNRTSWWEWEWNRHALVAFGYAENQTCVYFPVYDPNNPTNLNWVMYDRDTGESEIPGYKDWELENFCVMKTAKHDDIWLVRLIESCLFKQFLNNYTLAISNCPLDLTSSYGEGHFEETRYVSDIDWSSGFMEYSKEDSILKDAFYAVIYPDNVNPQVNNPQVKTEKIPETIDSITLMSIDSSYIGGISVEASELTLYDKEEGYDILASGTVCVESFNMTESQISNSTVTLQLSTESMINMSEGKFFIDIGNDGTVDEILIPPIAEFGFSIYNDYVLFDASPSYDPDGFIVNYTWNFGDGNTTTTTEETITHSYATEDDCNVILTVTDDGGAKHSVSRVIAVTALRGDLNSDGILTPADAAIALQIAAIGAHDDAADVSGDGQVTSLDAFMILQAAVENVEL